MYYLLAQAETPAVEPTERQVKAAELVVTKLLSGMEGASQKDPTNYMFMIGILVAIGAVIVVVVLFLRYLKDERSKLEERLRAADEADRIRETERQKHVEKMAAEYSASSLVSQRECHSHSREMITQRNEDSSTFKDIAHHIENAVVGLTGTVHSLAATATDFKDVAHNMRGLLQEKKIGDDMRRTQHIDLTVNPARPPIEGGGE